MYFKVIRCYHRILDLKGKHVDIEILRILVNAIGNNLENCDISLLKKQTLELFGRLTSLVNILKNKLLKRRINNAEHLN